MVIIDNCLKEDDLNILDNTITEASALHSKIIEEINNTDDKKNKTSNERICITIDDEELLDMLKEFQKYLDMNSTHALDMCDVFFDFTLLDNARVRMIEIKNVYLNLILRKLHR